MLRFLILISIVFSKTAAAQSDADSLEVVATEEISTKKETAVDSMLMYAETFIGTKYSYGSCGPKSFDCSGYVQHVFGKFGVELPHSSGSIASLCDEVKLKKVKPGDLLFFAGRKVSKKNIGHVSIVHKVDGNKITMIHATVQAGVISEVLEDSEYFNKRFISAGRLKSKDSKKKSDKEE